MGRGAHAGLVGEQPPLGPQAYRCLEGRAGGAAQNSLGTERVAEDHAHCLRNIADAQQHHGQPAQQIQPGHDGYQLFGDRGQPLGPAQKDEAADDRQYDTHRPAGDTEGVLKGLANGIGLDHAAEKAKSQNDGHSEKTCQRLAEAASEGGTDIVHRPAQNLAVGGCDPGLLGKNGFGINGSHAEEGDDPHPENGARPAGHDGAAGAHDVAGAHLGGDSGGQRLKGAHTPGLPAALE